MARGGPRPGSGRPYIADEERKIPVGFGATLSVIHRIDGQAREMGLRSRSEWLREAVEQMLNKGGKKQGVRSQPKPSKKAKAPKKSKPVAAPSAATPERYTSEPTLVS